MDTKTLDNKSMASFTAGVSLSLERLERMEPGLQGWRGRLFDWRLSLGHRGLLKAKDVFAEHLMHGDAAPALVVSLKPLHVAAYANEIDAVVMLSFEREPGALITGHNLEVGKRLLAIATYAPRHDEGGYARDIIPGPANSGLFGDASLLIADFLSEDDARLMLLKSAIPKKRWDHLNALTTQYREYFGVRTRRGDPLSVCFALE